MPLPTPELGLVINYQYLWRHEHLAGLEEGKERPCAIILAKATTEGRTEVVVAPITHREPSPPSLGVEVPHRVKEHLGLDWQKSWVIVTDLNAFVWPGYDIRPLPRGPSHRFDYGFIPPKLFDRIVAEIKAQGEVSRLATSRDAAE